MAKKIVDNMSKYRTFDGNDLDLFEAYPEGNSKGKIIVVSEIWGLSKFLKNFSKRLAEQGYHALAPDFYSRPGDREIFTEPNIMDAMRPLWTLPESKRRDPEAIKEIMSKSSEETNKIFQTVVQGREEMEKTMIKDIEALYNLHYKEGNEMGIVGFCMGGGLAFQVSTQRKFDASLIFYGASPRKIDDIAGIKGAVFGIYAGEDGSINASLDQVVSRMVQFKKDFEMKLYPGTYHAFFNDTGMSYNKPAAEDAWERAKEFFGRYIK